MRHRIAPVASHPIVAVMDEKPGWRRLIAADGVVIHVRTDQPR